MSEKQLLDLRFEGVVAVLTLDDGRGNALGTPMLQAIERALAEARAAHVLVIRGREKIFCGGLDLPALVPLDRAAILSFFEFFDRVTEAMLAFPRPIVTVARGSAVAGGAILLCAGDARLVTPEGKVGINEVALGLSLPTPALEIVRCALGDLATSETTSLGRLYDGDARLRIGFATEAVPADALDARAAAIAQQLAANDPDAVARVRLQLRRGALERVRAHAADDRRDFVDRWFTPETQKRLQAVVARLQPSRPR